MHDWVNHNWHYVTFNQFTKAIFDFFRMTLPEKCPEFRDTATDNFHIVSFREYKVIWGGPNLRLIQAQEYIRKKDW